MFRTLVTRPEFALALSQAATSASNFILSVAVARTSTLEFLGLFGIAILTFTNVQAFSRVTLGAGLLLVKNSRRSDLAGHASVQWWLAMLTAATTAVTAVIVLGSTVTTLLLAIGSLIGIVQDGARFRAISTGKWRTLVTSDFVWLALVLPAPFIATSRADAEGAVLPVALWAAGAGASLLVMAAGGVGIAGRGSVGWLRRHRAELAPLAGESGVFVATGYVVNWIAAFAGGSSGYGVLRAAQVLFSPLGPASQVGTLAILRGDGAGRLSRDRQFWSILVVLEVTVMGWTAALLVTDLGPALIGESWYTLAPVLGFVAVGQAATVFTAGVLAWTKRRWGSLVSFRFRVSVTWMDPVAVAVVGSSVAVTGVAVGLAASQLAVGVLAAVFVMLFPSVVRRRVVKEGGDEWQTRE